MYVVKVSGMTCASCAETIGDSLQAIDSSAEALYRSRVSVRLVA